MAGDGRQEVHGRFAKRDLVAISAVCAAELFGRNHEAQGVKAKARPAGDDEIAGIQQTFVTLPRGNFEELVRADDEVEVIFWMFAAETADGVNRVKNVAGPFKGCFGDRRNIMRVVRAGERNHCIAMQKWGQVALGLVRRTR